MRIFLGSSHLQPVIEKNIFKMYYHFKNCCYYCFSLLHKTVTVGAYREDPHFLAYFIHTLSDVHIHMYAIINMIIVL